MDPAFSFYHNDSTEVGGTPVSAGNPLSFGLVPVGVPSSVITFHLWNDKKGLVGSDEAVSPMIRVLPSPEDPEHILSGTIGNDFSSMIEMRSCGAVNESADVQNKWTPVSDTAPLIIGNMKRNSMREIEIRINPPIDSDPITLRQLTISVEC